MAASLQELSLKTLLHHNIPIPENRMQFVENVYDRHIKPFSHDLPEWTQDAPDLTTRIKKIYSAVKREEVPFNRNQFKSLSLATITKRIRRAKNEELAKCFQCVCRREGHLDQFFHELTQLTFHQDASPDEIGETFRTWLKTHPQILDQVRRIYIHHPELNSLPKEIELFKRLETLDLSGTPLAKRAMQQHFLTGFSAGAFLLPALAKATPYLPRYFGTLLTVVTGSSVQITHLLDLPTVPLPKIENVHLCRLDIVGEPRLYRFMGTMTSFAVVQVLVMLQEHLQS